MTRIELQGPTPRDAIDDIAAALGLLLVNIVPKTDAHPAQLIYVTPDRLAAVHLLDGGDAGASCWVVRAEGEGAAAIEARWSASLREAAS